MNNKILLIYSDEYLKHNTGPSHPESPERLKSIMTYLTKSDLMKRLVILEPNPASLEWIEEIHSVTYINDVKNYSEQGMTYIHSYDNQICPESYRVAILAVGGVLYAVDNVMEEEFKKAFCLIRPPGHHSLRDEAMGFCLFNNIAIAAKYLLKKYQLKRILIVDWDVHHGNGTQSAFYEDPEVLYFSIHQHPLYPGSGMEWEKGKGAGEGFTMNFPVPPGTGDEVYIKIFSEKLYPKAIEYNPEFVLISAGFDAHKEDPLASISLTENAYRELTDIVVKIADECSGGRIVSVLEGGYNLKFLPLCVAEHLKSLIFFEEKK
jgi:acetoin utilization deacetylase AcuC-like enzyme